MPNDAHSQSPGRSPGLIIAVFIVVVAAAVSGIMIKRWLTPVSFLDEATAAIKRGDRHAAAEALQQHLATAPDSSVARLRLAGLISKEEPNEALDLLESIPEDAPEYSAAVNQIAVLCLVTGKTDRAESALLELAEINPDQLGPQLSLAELYFHRKTPKAALPFAERAAELDPTRTRTLLLIAEICDDMRQHARMTEPLRKAIKLDPNLYEARINLAYACYKTGDLQEAEQQAQWCLDRNPADVFAVRTLGSIARDQGRFEDAAGFVQMALKLRPNDVDTRILEADLLLYHQKPSEAYQRLKSIYDSQQATYRYLGALARAAAAAGNRDEARRLHQMMSDLRR